VLWKSKGVPEGVLLRGLGNHMRRLSRGNDDGMAGAGNRMTATNQWP
jgi:hypothetical protein